MIELKDITKVYGKGEEQVIALNGLSVTFPSNEFVSIVGPSGCGKTTLLNVIGGLDHYTSGDLLINNKSTKSYSTEEWDYYRNSMVGFVFQSYNLIPHLNVIDNVMMALSLSGVPHAERYERAKKALEDVGLANQLKKKPNALSGGQMQRVAIARAIVNNPKILLADEPTGALDSKTSIQIMELIKKIAADRLVIMVSHNQELAAKYSDRIIEMMDGKILNDSRPAKEEAEANIPAKEALKNKKTSMSFLEALKSSFKNLMTKKGRTIATSIAGSIGIIGIGLVLSLSSGISSTIGTLQSSALAGFPVSIEKTVITQSIATETTSSSDYPKGDVYYPYDSTGGLVTHTNKIDTTLIEYLEAMDSKLTNSISYSKDVAINMIFKNDGGVYGKISAGGSSTRSSLSELPNSEKFILTQYDILSGSYPTSSKDLVLVVDKDNKISKTLLDTLGITEKDSYTASDFTSRTFKVIGNDEFYALDAATSTYKEKTNYASMYNSTSANVFETKISCILRIKESSESSFLSTGLSYSYLLTNDIIANDKASAVVVAQTASETKSVLTGLPFDTRTTYNGTMKTLGGDDTPTGINIYPSSFNNKDKVKKYIDKYNDGKSSADKIVYTDMAEVLTSVMSTMVNAITIVLTAVAAISLVVSTVMISIIIYVSVIERTKEIGIMRSIGARRRDISRIFSAEAISIGAFSGLLGVIVTYLLDIPLSLAIAAVLKASFTAVLQPYYALLLFAISVFLTFLAGLLPASSASNKDPVVALRTE